MNKVSTTALTFASNATMESSGDERVDCQVLPELAGSMKINWEKYFREAGRSGQFCIDSIGYASLYRFDRS